MFHNIYEYYILIKPMETFQIVFVIVIQAV